jgi:hypothetical protein
MKNFIWIAIVAFMFFGCSKDEPTPVSELIKKSWSVSSAQWDGTTQYTKGGSSNLVNGYAQFKLDLSVAGSVTLTEFDGKQFTGTYLLASDNTKITLSNLKGSEGAPTGSNGTLEFRIVGIPTATTLGLETTSTYIKASNKRVGLTLVNP